MSAGAKALDALVVLGCRVRADGRVGAALARRVDLAAALFRAGIAPRVVMSGGRLWDGVSEADAMLEHWLGQGLSSAPVLLERESLTTRQNARWSAKLLHAQGMSHVGVVTCDFHLPRALSHFEAEGFSARGYPACVSRPLSRRLWLRARELGARLLEPFAP